MVSGLAVGTVAIVMLCLGLFGVVYNQVVARLEAAKQDHGYVSILVVGGVAVTLGGMGLVDLVVDWNAGLIGLGCFACSGAPMVVGSMARHLARQTAERLAVAEMAKELLDDEA